MFNSRLNNKSVANELVFYFQSNNKILTNKSLNYAYIYESCSKDKYTMPHTHSKTFCYVVNYKLSTRYFFDNVAANVQAFISTSFSQSQKFNFSSHVLTSVCEVLS